MSCPNRAALCILRRKDWIEISDNHARDTKFLDQRAQAMSVTSTHVQEGHEPVLEAFELFHEERN